MAPWTCGYNQAKSLANVGLFATVRGAAREALFQWVGPLVQSRTCFYSHQDSPLRINSLADAARDGRLAVPRQWYSHEYLSSQGLNNIFTVTSPEKMMTMFQNRRINLLVASDVSLPQMLTQQGMQVNAVKRQLCFMQHQSYLAFSCRPMRPSSAAGRAACRPCTPMAALRASTSAGFPAGPCRMRCRSRPCQWRIASSAFR